MYGYIYETTCKVNGKKYIGQHKGEFDSRYLGSGTALLLAIKKYGRKQFESKLIEYCDCLQQLCDRERYWIAKLDAMNSDMYYNITCGGETFPDGKLAEQLKANISKKFQERIANGWVSPLKGVPLSEEHKRNVSLNHADVSGANNPNFGRPMSDEQKAKISQTRKDKGLATGKNNPMYGKRGKDNPNYGRKNSEETLQRMRDNSIRGKKLMNNGLVVKMVSPSEFQEYLAEGWKFGKLKSSSTTIENVG